MRHFVVLFIHLIAILSQLLQPGGVRSLVAESLSAQTPAPDRKLLSVTISHSILVGPDPCRLDGALGPSYSSSPFRDCTEPATLLALHKAMSKRKYRIQHC
jgi:hypothetical protein